MANDPTGPSYKVVELSEVSDQRIEDALNAWTREGFRFDSVHFVTVPGSRRPAMAFLFFTRPAAWDGEAR